MQMTVTYGKDIQQQKESMHQVLQRFREKALTLNEKCEFAKNSIMTLDNASSRQGQSHQGDA